MSNFLLQLCLLLMSVRWPAGMCPKHMSSFLAPDPMKSDLNPLMSQTNNISLKLCKCLPNAVPVSLWRTTHS